MRRSTLALVLVLLISAFAVPIVGAQAPDVIHTYDVTITPDSQGNLEMRYEFNYTASTDFPSGGAYLEVGVPNRNFTLIDYGPKDWVTGAQEKKSGGSFVHLDFAHLPRANENFSFFFVIRQENMANKVGEEVAFQFTPGWFDFARIDRLTINWKLPEDPAAVLLTEPAPEISGNTATWNAENLKVNQKFTVNLKVAASAFPDMTTPTVDKDPHEGVSPTSSGGAICGGSVFLIVVVVIIVVFVVIFVGSLLIDNNDYSTGSTFGTTTYYHDDNDDDDDDSPVYRPSRPSCVTSSPTYHRPSTPSRPSSPSPRPRTGGGGGGFSGRSSSSRSSCVKSSCACACACAGGGRAGCTQKGFGIHGLVGRIRRKLHENGVS